MARKKSQQHILVRAVTGDNFERQGRKVANKLDAFHEFTQKPPQNRIFKKSR